MSKEEYNIKLLRIEEYNIKWLKYMGANPEATECPNGHMLSEYTPFDNGGVLIVCCPVDDCDYYDYNTYRRIRK